MGHRLENINLVVLASTKIALRLSGLSDISDAIDDAREAVRGSRSRPQISPKSHAARLSNSISRTFPAAKDSTIEIAAARAARNLEGIESDSRIISEIALNPEDSHALIANYVKQKSRNEDLSELEEQIHDYLIAELAPLFKANVETLPNFQGMLVIEILRTVNTLNSKAQRWDVIAQKVASFDAEGENEKATTPGSTSEYLDSTSALIRLSKGQKSAASNSYPLRQWHIDYVTRQINPRPNERRIELHPEYIDACFPIERYANAIQIGTMVRRQLEAALIGSLDLHFPGRHYTSDAMSSATAASVVLKHNLAQSEEDFRLGLVREAANRAASLATLSQLSHFEMLAELHEKPDTLEQKYDSILAVCRSWLSVDQSTPYNQLDFIAGGDHFTAWMPIEVISPEPEHYNFGPAPLAPALRDPYAWSMALVPIGISSQLRIRSNLGSPIDETLIRETIRWIESPKDFSFGRH